ncbi:thioredoxin [Candidatus Chlorohelix sp.]|uniref:thioredoxin n=1 Tax=Candidatus Chlorohelix sp. TaxID=3139201 RepID=UPI00304FD95E
MPVLVNHNKCNCAPTCFAANACPNDALHVDKTALRVWVEPEKCGTCPGRCLNFCDAVALKFAPSLVELEIMQKELAGELNADQALEARNKLMEEMKEKAEAERRLEEDESLKPIAVTVNNFKAEVVDSAIPVFIDFWAEWCAPCKQIAPIIDVFAKEYQGRMKFVKINVDEEQMIASQFSIQSIPTMIIMYRGQLADMIVGAVDRAALKNRLDRVLQAVAQFEAQQATPAEASTEQQQPKPQPAKIRPELMRPNINLRNKPPRR